MSRLTIVGYDDPDEAEEVRLKLRKLQREYVIDLKDAVEFRPSDYIELGNVTVNAIGGWSEHPACPLLLKSIPS